VEEQHNNVEWQARMRERFNGTVLGMSDPKKRHKTFWLVSLIVFALAAYNYWLFVFGLSWASAPVFGFNLGQFFLGEGTILLDISAIIVITSWWTSTAGETTQLPHILVDSESRWVEVEKLVPVKNSLFHTESGQQIKVYWQNGKPCFKFWSQESEQEAQLLATLRNGELERAKRLNPVRTASLEIC
jgi:hypothetical protein